MHDMNELETKILIEKIKLGEGKKNPKTLEKLKKKYYNVVEKFDKITNMGKKKFEPDRAFITFLFQGQKLNILELYSKNHSNKFKMISDKLRNNSNEQIDSRSLDSDKNLVFKGQEVKIRSADEPTSVNFENIGITKREKIKRNLVGLGVILLLILFFFLFMIVLTLCAQIQAPNCDSEKNYDEILTNPTLKWDWEYIDCYCKKNMIHENIQV